MTKVVGYLEAGSIADGNFDKLDMSMVTHLIWEGMETTSSTNPALKELYGYPLSQLTSFVTKCHANGVIAMGAIFGTDYFTKAMVPGSSYWTNVVNNIVNFAVQWSLDGIEIDWENGPPIDRYDALLIELSGRLGAVGKFVTGCDWGAKNPGENRISSAVVPYVEWIDIMAYGGGIDNNGGTFDNTKLIMQYWSTIIPKEKLIAGLSFAGLSPTVNGSYIWARWRDIVDKFNPNNDQTVGYATTWVDGRTIPGGYIKWWNNVDVAGQKTKWIIDNGYGGVMAYTSGIDKLNHPASLLKSIDNVVKAVEPTPTEDIGAPCIERSAGAGNGTFTCLSIENPSKKDGILSEVKLRCKNTMPKVYVGTYYLVSGTYGQPNAVYKCRASTLLGAVEAGTVESYETNLPVLTGDLIGIYGEWTDTSYKYLDYTYSGGKGIYYVKNPILEGVQSEFKLMAGWTLSICGSITVPEVPHIPELKIIESTLTQADDVVTVTFKLGIK